jgi:hypothetical protein
MQESGLLTDHVSENIYRYNPGCFIWANSDQDRLSGHGICQIAPKYNFKTIEVSVHGTGIYTLTISDRDGLALAANPAKLQASMKMMTDWLFLNRSYLYGVEVGILSGPSCIASATRTTKNLTRMRICS